MNPLASLVMKELLKSTPARLCIAILTDMAVYPVRRATAVPTQWYRVSNPRTNTKRSSIKLSRFPSEAALYATTIHGAEVRLSSVKSMVELRGVLRLAAFVTR